MSRVIARIRNGELRGERMNPSRYHPREGNDKKRLIVRPLTPHRWCRLLGHSINWPLLQQSHCLLHRALELRIAPGNYVLGPILDIDIRTNPLIFDCPFAITSEEAATRCDHRAAVDERGRIGRMDQPTPRALAHQWSNFPVPEHIGHQVAA